MSNNAKQSRYFFFILLGFTLVVAFRIVAPYLSLIILTFILVTIFMPVFNFFEQKLRRTSIANILAVSSVIFTLVVPFLFLFYITFLQFQIFVDDINTFISSGAEEGNAQEIFDTALVQINKFIDRIPNLEYELTEAKIQEFVENNISPALNFVLGRLTSFTSGVPDLITKSIIFIYLLFAMFPNYNKILSYIKNLSPLQDDVDQLYINNFLGMSKSMILGTLVIGVVQGVLSGLVLQYVGVRYAVFLTFFMIFLSIIPLGSGIVTLPLGVIFIITGNWTKGLLLIFMHFVVITNIDNILRPIFVPKSAEMHPVILLVSVFGGISLFGFLGFIYGPVIMILLLSTFKVYKKYYRNDAQIEKEL